MKQTALILPVSTLIKQFGVDPSGLLLAALEVGRQSRDLCTADHPANYRGFVFYGEATAAVRQRLRPLGFDRHSEGGLELTRSRDKSFAICVVRGDENVGREDADPQIYRAKGEASRTAVKHGWEQEEMFACLPESAKANLAPSIHFLLWTEDDEGLLRAELSKPTGIGGGGLVLGWESRVLLKSGPGPFATVRGCDDAPQGPDAVEVEVKVSRR